MAGRWSRDKVLRSIVEQCRLPDGYSVEPGRFGGIAYADSGLIRRLKIYASKVPGKLRWQVEVSDAELEQPDSTAFRTTYEIDDTLVGGEVSSRNRIDYPWPTSTIDHLLVWDITRFAPKMLWFLANRHELGLMLLRGDESPGSSSLIREGITARRWSGGAASLGHAVILARHMHDTELETLAFAKLDRLRDAEMHDWNFPEAVGYWAREAAKWSPVDISDLTAIRRTRQRRK
jgi:hypothetical protein